ncbi:MAG: hypothetical protein V4710_16750 [Verrucomicrobiota bacterium]
MPASPAFQASAFIGDLDGGILAESRVDGKVGKNGIPSPPGPQAVVRRGFLGCIGSLIAPGMTALFHALG